MNPRLLLEQYDISPKKALGQNFLHDPNALEKIVETADLMPEDTVLEIGPGTGSLTRVLARMAAKVVAVELDQRLRPLLDDLLRDEPHVTVVYEDILHSHPRGLVGTDDYIVVANVPYYITGAILKHLLDSSHPPRRLVLTVQLEVAERLIAQPGDLSLIAVITQFYGRPKIATRLRPGVFYPRPEVDSAVVRIDIHDRPPVDVPGKAQFFAMVKAGFSQKRKQIKNSIGAGLGLSNSAAAAMIEAAGIDPRRRAETLSLDEWAALTRTHAARR